ncbi:MAG: hypothetical protein ACJAU6_003487 [Alphaproteobacteria bacterium]|jgi:hypothetical protein
MKFNRTFTVLIGAAIGLAGCETADDALWPSISGTAPTSAAAHNAKAQPLRINIPEPKPASTPTAPAAYVAATPSLASSSAAGVDTFQTTGTFVGKKVGQMRTDLRKLQTAVDTLNQRMATITNENSSASRGYHALVADMNGQLQVGTTPGNPVMVKKWNEAQQRLEAISESMNRMDTLSNDSAGEAGMAAWLLDSVRATYSLSGAVDEDHRQLRILEDEVHRTIVLVDRLLNELSEDISRQSTYVGNERRNMTTMSLAVKNGELYGTSLVNRAFAQSQALASAEAQATGPTKGDQALVVIRFDRPGVAYQQALYNAVSRALERKPNASFDILAVSPQRGSAAQVALSGTQAKRDAEGVLRALADMGLPPNRVKLSSSVSPDADSNEVHIFVR